ncbi:MAG: hypothetical protein KC593_09530 [Myxococcales bacterium]|nr:hypothetical protein [Myxococcales bacterium]MCB9628490.1 hypothetical protein [Sandaracinaceae bacterium]
MVGIESKPRTGAVVVAALTLAALVSGASDTARAQQSMFGSATLTSGFLPDPHVLQGQSGGNVDASGVNAQCRGFISPHPSHIVTLNGNFRWMRVFVESAGDTTIMIQTPQNTVLCNDDTYGLNPAVEQAWGPGLYRIWVGSYQQGTSVPYSLKLTEIASVVPGSSQGQGVGPQPMPIDPRVNPNPNPQPNPQPAQGLTMTVDAMQGNGTPGWIDARLRPDPAVLEGAAGGTIRAQEAAEPSCRGFVQSIPDHILYVQGRARYLRLYVEASEDTTMVIRTPDGRWLCDDDGGGNLQPMLEQESWAPGQYLVWIGTYSARGTGTVPYRLMATRQQPAAARPEPAPRRGGGSSRHR